MLCTYHQESLCLREQGFDELWLFFEPKMGPPAKHSEKLCSQYNCTIFYIFIYQLHLGCHSVTVNIYTQTIHRTTQITEQHK
jgi:hypothetical protein